MQLKEIKRGEAFKHCGLKWTVLEHDQTGHTLALSERIIEKMLFDEGKNNHFAKSSLCNHLNGDFLLGTLCEGRKPQNHGFNLYTLDLTTDDGCKDYGSYAGYIFILNDDLYRRHRDAIKPLDEEWWTATALSACAPNSCFSRYVSPSGVLNSYNACRGHFGVRPACYLDSDLLLEDKDEMEEALEDLERFSEFDPRDRKIVLDFAYFLLKKYCKGGAEK